MSGPSSTGQPVVIQWILDTRTLWPEAEKTAQLETAAHRALSLLTDEERAGVLKYYHVRDAKMALGSHLLKRLVISKYAGVPWRDVHLTRNARGKPIFTLADGTEPVSFNVSHQAGLVALVALAAVAGYPPGPVDVGVDVVCTDERRARDHKMIAEEGWPAFVDMHADVFAPSEAGYLKYQILAAVPGLRRGAGLEEVVDFKLRCFYTLWCLREAYVKMTGEALLAEWLSALEFRNFRPPLPAAAAAPGGEEAVTAHEIYFRGQRVDDANVCLRSLGPDFMTCTAVRTPEKKEDGLGFELGPFEMMPMDELLDFAERQM
ncbi:Phosphopantetheinyl transferase [Pleurostoma richardsiae]|uniref:holo-[acyl-carrier-protein] synthase n=1 Tax=Pleurostoma richardsiae TaxID=41990 RepID=A0AA38VYQ7_9PEZI|nr:Phosphopantetheinyl transferase [Pleurostoma richardsiae]